MNYGFFPYGAAKRMQAPKKRKFVSIVETFCANLLNYLKRGVTNPCRFHKMDGLEAKKDIFGNCVAQL